MATKELPQDLTDRIAREDNEADRELIAGPVRRGAQYLKDKILGTEEQNRKGQEMLDKQAGEGSRIAKMLGGKGMKSGGMTASKRADGCAIKGKTRGKIC